MAHHPSARRALLALGPACALAVGCAGDAAGAGAQPQSGPLHVVASAALAVTAAVALTRPAPGRTNLPLGFLAVALAVWNASEAAWSWTATELWRRVGAASAVLAAPLLLHLALAFTGRLWSQRAARRALAAAAALAGLWAAAVLALPGPLPGWSWWVHDAALGAALLASGALLVARLRTAPSPADGARTRLMLTAICLGSLLSFSESDLLAGVRGPHLGALGAPAALGIAALVTLRLQARGRELSTLNTTYGAALGACGVAAYLGVFELARAHPALLTPGTVAVTLVLLAAVRDSVGKALAERQRLEQLATLGRFSAQLAHDLKNPLTALKGAAQFLKGEQARRGAPEEGDFLDLMLQQIERMQRVVENYQRLGRVEPVRAPLAVNDLVREVMALQTFAVGDGVEVRAEYADGLPAVPADRDLLAVAVENLVRNAFESMPRGGVLRVRTAASDPSEEPGVVIAVEDTGVGMDALTRERAMESFFTTKAQGSGLGLAFVRRVTEAHEGDLALTSREGLGTIVRLRLPLN